jgi:hypothetical protein
VAGDARGLSVTFSHFSLARSGLGETTAGELIGCVAAPAIELCSG